MPRTHRFPLALITGAAIALTASTVSAQTSGQSVDLHFDGAIAVPISMKSMHPDLNYVQMSCLVKPPAGAPTTTVTMTDNPNPGSSMSGGQWSGTLTYHFTAHRSATFTPGEVWSYDCALDVLKKTSTTSGPSDGGMPGVGPSFKWFAQLASGNARFQGTFTLQ
jgi:hypothetical protein